MESPTQCKPSEDKRKTLISAWLTNQRFAHVHLVAKVQVVQDLEHKQSARATGHPE
jgi:hypothetical protein